MQKLWNVKYDANYRQQLDPLPVSLTLAALGEKDILIKSSKTQVEMLDWTHKSEKEVLKLRANGASYLDEKRCSYHLAVRWWRLAPDKGTSSPKRKSEMNLIFLPQFSWYSKPVSSWGRCPSFFGFPLSVQVSGVVMDTVAFTIN